MRTTIDDERRESAAHAERAGTLTEAMTDAGVDALLVHGVGAVGQYGDVAYLIGWVPDNKGLYVLARRGRSPLIIATDTRQAAALSRVSHLTGVDLITASAPSAAAIAATVVAQAGDRSVAISSSVPLEAARELRGRLGLRYRPDSVDLIARLREHTSAADRQAMRDTACILDDALLHLRNLLRPGMTEAEAAALVEAHLISHGSVLRIVHVSADHFAGQRPGPRPISPGELITVFAESTGSRGHWVEVGAIFHLGEVDQVRQAISQIIVDAIRVASEQIQQGAAVGQIADNLQAELGSHGTPTIGWGHGVGVDETSWTIDALSQRYLNASDAVALHPSLQPVGAPHLAVAAATTILIDNENSEPLSQLANRLHHIPVR